MTHYSFTLKAKNNKEFFDKLNEGLQTLPLKQNTWHDVQSWGENHGDYMAARVYVTEIEPKDK